MLTFELCVLMSVVAGLLSELGLISNVPAGWGKVPSEMRIAHENRKGFVNDKLINVFDSWNSVALIYVAV